MSTLTQFLQDNAAQRSERTVFIGPNGDHRLTYAALADTTAQLQAFFDQNGVSVGAHVGMFLPNGLTASTLFLATMACGRVIVPLSLLSQHTQLTHVLAHAELTLVFTTAELASKLPAQRSEVKISIVDADQLAEAPWRDLAATGRVPIEISQQDNALLMYTSGTTGQPKGVSLTHGNIVYAATQLAAWHGLDESDRVLSSLPLYHINGQILATVMPLVTGGSAVVPSKFSVGQWWELATRYKVTWLNLVPTIIAYLLNGPVPSGALTGIRFARSASAPLSPEHQRAFEARFGMPVIEGMGMTESASVVFCNPMPPAARKLGSAGVPVAVQAKILDTSGQTLADGAIGEIHLKGGNVMSGYHRAPQQTAQAFADDGWLRSGDLGYRDSDGFYFITGRLKELIIKGGENIAPREIDEALLAHPAILEAAAVGVPDANYGEEILAAVVLKPDHVASERDLRVYCEERLGAFKSPKLFRFVSALPKGPSGKVQRLKLREQH